MLTWNNKPEISFAVKSFENLKKKIANKISSWSCTVCDWDKEQDQIVNSLRLGTDMLSLKYTLFKMKIFKCFSNIISYHINHIISYHISKSNAGHPCRDQTILFAPSTWVETDSFDWYEQVSFCQCLLWVLRQSCVTIWDASAILAWLLSPANSVFWS